MIVSFCTTTEKPGPGGTGGGNRGCGGINSAGDWAESTVSEGDLDCHQTAAGAGGGGTVSGGGGGGLACHRSAPDPRGGGIISGGGGGDLICHQSVAGRAVSVGGGGGLTCLVVGVGGCSGSTILRPLFLAQRA